MGNQATAAAIDFSDLGGKVVSPAASSGSGSGSGVPIDFSDLGGKVVQAASKSANDGTITGIEATPAPTGLSDRISRWADNVSNDIKYGTDTTGIGTVLKKMGAHGVYNGNSQAVGDYMASLPLGLLRTAKGTAESATGSPMQGAKDTAGGLLQASEIPASLGIPEEAEIPPKIPGAVAKIPGAIGDMVPSAARAGRAFEDLRSTIGEHTVGMTDALGKSLSDIKELVDTGASTPQVINKFVTRVADLDQPPLTYTEARNFYTNASRLSVSDKMSLSPQMKRAIASFTQNLGDAIGNTADQAGKLQQLQDAMQEYSKAMRMKEVAGNAVDMGKDLAVKSLLGGGAAYAGYRGVRDVLGY